MSNNESQSVKINGVLIARNKTCDDWRKLRSQLVLSSNAEQWQSAFDEFFMGRIELRYLEPIKTLNNFETALHVFIDQYAIALKSVKGLQDAFIRKFDDLCR